MKLAVISALAIVMLGCTNSNKSAMTSTKEDETCADSCCQSKGATLSCKLTTNEMQQRKATVLASLKKQMLEKKELPNGYSYKFPGTDTMLDELTEFIKTERQCCDFFTFNLSVAGNGSEAWLNITGPVGAKDFITTELEL